MQTVFLVTDSTADLPKEIASGLGITVVPLKVIFGSGEAYQDGVEIEAAEFYRRQVEKNEYSSTSQPTPAEFAEVYSRLAADGRSIISIHLSANLSGTVQSAHMAAAMLPEADIKVVDSRLASMGFGLIVMEAAQAAREGKSKAEIMSLVTYMVENTQVFFFVGTLEYLVRGGRIGKAQAFLGSLLNIRPILYLKEGIVQPFEKVRGKARALERLVQAVEEKFGNRALLCSLVHSIDPEGLEQLRLKAKEKLNIANEPIVASELGAVIGTHTGPGVVGIVCCPQKKA